MCNKVITSLLCLCCFFCLEGGEPIESVATTIFSCAETNDTNGIAQTASILQTSLMAAQDPVTEARKFLQSFVDEINTRYETQLTIEDACRLVKEHLGELQIPQELHAQLLRIIELFEEKSQEFAPYQMEKCTAAQIHWHFYPPWEWNFFGLNKHHHHSHHHAHHCAAQIDRPQFELPAKMAVGVISMFSGAMICLLPIPGAQMFGAGIITTGFFYALDGMVDGERPYYRNHETGGGYSFWKSARVARSDYC